MRSPENSQPPLEGAPAERTTTHAAVEMNRRRMTNCGFDWPACTGDPELVWVRSTGLVPVTCHTCLQNP